MRARAKDSWPGAARVQPMGQRHVIVQVQPQRRSDAMAAHQLNVRHPEVGPDPAPAQQTRPRRSLVRSGPSTLAIDIGGTHLKAVVLGPDGSMLVDEVVVATPHPCPPRVLLKATDRMIQALPGFDRVSVGFPGVVRAGTIITAPHLGTRSWHRFPLADTLAARLDRPVRVLNDADVQGFGLITGQGLEMVLTLGTGAGTALFRDGELMPHLELAHHPIHNDLTYDEYIGADALNRKGVKKWRRRVHRTIAILRSLVNYDILHIGGGNAGKIIDPPQDVRIGRNQAGLTGGIRLWQSDPQHWPHRRRH